MWFFQFQFSSYFMLNHLSRLYASAGLDAGTYVCSLQDADASSVFTLALISLRPKHWSAVWFVLFQQW